MKPIRNPVSDYAGEDAKKFHKDISWIEGLDLSGEIGQARAVLTGGQEAERRYDRGPNN